MWKFFGQRLINLGGKGIINLIDVGSIGALPPPWHENPGKVHHLLKFEPLDKPNKNRFVTTLDIAISGENGERDFYVYKSQHGSSLYEQNHELVRENYQKLKNLGPKNLADTWFERSRLIKVEKIQCRKLDDILQELNHPFPYHFIKIDAQGAEYEILKGSETFLKEDCVGLYLELFVYPLYKGIALLPQVKHHLKELGFDLIIKEPAHGTFDSQHNCLFLKRGKKGGIINIIKEIYNVQ